MKSVGWVIVMLALPAAGAILGAGTGPTLARTHPTVSLAERVRMEDDRQLEDRTLASEAFRDTGRPTISLYAEAGRIESTFVWGTALVGVWIGLTVAGKLWGAAHRTEGPVAVVDHAQCVSCGRCYASCPREHVRWKTGGAAQP